MTPSRHRFNLGCLACCLAAFSVCACICSGIWREAEYLENAELNGRAYSQTVREMTAFVEAAGRWPSSEEEYLRFRGGSLDRRERERALERMIVVYDVDLAEEPLRNAAEFRLLLRRDPRRFARPPELPQEMKALLDALRAVRDARQSAPANPTSRS